MTKSLLRHDTSSQGKQRWKRWVFRRLRNVDREDADVTCCGRPFHACAAATGKVLSPMVDRCVRQATSDEDGADRTWRRRLRSADRQSSSARQHCRNPFTTIVLGDHDFLLTASIFGNLTAFKASFSHIFTAHAENRLLMNFRLKF